MKESLSYNAIMAQYNTCYSEASEWRSEWRRVSDNILPGRGVFQTYSKPRKRKLTNNKIVNPIAEESLNVLVAEIHARLTSPSRMWFDLDWVDDTLKELEPLSWWLTDATKKMHTA
jgi:hypothetical protein